MKDTNAVSKAIVVHKDKILLLKPVNKSKWHLPGGHLVKGESFQQGMMREVYEETGIHVNHYVCINTQHNFKLFLCKASRGNVKLSNEHEKHAWLSPQQSIKTLDMTKETVRDIQLVIMCIKKFGAFFTQNNVNKTSDELQQEHEQVNTPYGKKS